MGRPNQASFFIDMNYNCWKVSIENDSIHVKIPEFDLEQWGTAYVQKISQQFFDHVKEAAQNVYYDSAENSWIFSLSELNLLFIANYLRNNDMQEDVIFDDDVYYYLDEIEKVQSEIHNHLIQLDFVNGKPIMKNASDELIDYLKQNEIINVWQLIDKSIELCYGLSSNVLNLLDNSVEHTMLNNQYVTLYTGSKNERAKLEQIIQYALKYKRTPIVFYKPDNSQDPNLGHYSELVTKVVNKLVNKSKIGVVLVPPSPKMKSNCDVYYSYSIQTLIQSDIKPQLIFFTRMVNENSFNILIDQIPKVCYYSNIKSKEGMVGPGQNYYAKV